MTIECSRCGGNHMRSECSLEPKTLSVCAGEGIKRMSPQGIPFHWKDGWMFCRGEANTVHIYRNDSQNFELKIPAGEWDSIVRYLDGKSHDPAFQ